jgi:hypothetical protein
VQEAAPMQRKQRGEDLARAICFAVERTKCPAESQDFSWPPRGAPFVAAEARDAMLARIDKFGGDTLARVLLLGEAPASVLMGWDAAQWAGRTVGSHHIEGIGCAAVLLPGLVAMLLDAIDAAELPTHVPSHVLLPPADELIRRMVATDKKVLAGTLRIIVPVGSVPGRCAVVASPNEAALRAAFTGRTKAIVINTPHNPTGSMLDAADLDALEELLSHSDALLLSDEVYEHLVYDGRRHLSVLSRPALAERAFAVFSFGKTFHATGWKTGYCVAPPALTTEFRRVHQFVTFVAVTPIQHALADFMRDHPEHIAGLGAFYQAKRDFFCDALEGSGWQGERASGSFFQLLDYSRIADVPDTEMAERLVRDHGVAAIPISVFYENPPHLRLLRFCFAKQEQTLSRGAERLLAL